MQKSVSIIITTKNEEKNLKELLPTLSFANEIIVVDSFSTDKSIEIAKSFNSKTFQREFDYHAAQKNWGLQKTTNNWVLILDADERISKELETEIKNVIDSNPIEKAFWIKRRNFLMGKEVKYSGWQNDKVIRLIDKRFCKYNNKLVHEEIETSERTSTLTNKLTHFTYTDINQYFDKFFKYSTQKAILKHRKGKKSNLFHILIKPSFKFFKRYIINKGILDGVIGGVVCAMAAFQDFVVYLKLWRLKNKT